MVEASELAAYVRVTEIKDVHDLQRDGRRGGRGRSAFVRHAQTDVDVTRDVPVGVGGHEHKRARRASLLQKRKSVRQHTRRHGGNVTVGVGHDELSVLPLDGDRTELMILEPVSNSLI